MKVIRGFEELGGCSAALGYFDGVHAGHAAVIAAAGRQAKKYGLPLAVFTFSFARERLAAKGRADIFTVEERLSRLASLGVEAVCLFDFDDIRDLTPQQFVERILRGCMGARAVCTGPDFRFGGGGAGDTAALAALCGPYGIETCVCPERAADGRKVSTTHIKELLAAGEIGDVNALLSRPYSLTLPVEHGDERGRTMGFATANQSLPSGILPPRFGVYATVAEIGGRAYPAVTNVGTRPTFYRAGTALFETHLLDFAGDLYGRPLTVRFCRYLRGEKRFASIEQLMEQIRNDCENARRTEKP